MIPAVFRHDAPKCLIRWDNPMVVEQVGALIVMFLRDLRSLLVTFGLTFVTLWRLVAMASRRFLRALAGSRPVFFDPLPPGGVSDPGPIAAHLHGSPLPDVHPPLSRRRWLFSTVVIAMWVPMLLWGCATTNEVRIVFPVERAEQVKSCAESGCVLIPVGLWSQIIRVLKANGLIEGA